MKQLNLSLTDKEYNALCTLLLSRYECCRSICVWDECKKAAKKIKNEDETYHYCDICAFTKAVIGLERKIINE